MRRMALEQEAMTSIIETTKAICEKHMLAKMEEYTELRLEWKLREIVKEELVNLMRETENIFVLRVADALVEKVKEKLAEAQ
jgi:hypothetical protein